MQLRSEYDYKLWVEVDSSFDETNYDIKWVVTQSFINVLAKGEGNIVSFHVSNENVSYCPKIQIYLKTKKDRHRFSKYHDEIEFTLDEVLPSIEDTY